MDLPQAAIGPGMAVFSRYSAVLEDDGSLMTVRTALQRINAILDEVLTGWRTTSTGETRFALTCSGRTVFDTGKFGDARSIANARGCPWTAWNGRASHQGGGKVALIAPSDMPADYDPATDESISQWEVVMRHPRAGLRRCPGRGVVNWAGCPAASTGICARNGPPAVQAGRGQEEDETGRRLQQPGCRLERHRPPGPTSSWQPTLTD